jgi:hypothetical protein
MRLFYIDTNGTEACLPSCGDSIRQPSHLLIVLFRLFTCTSVLWISIMVWIPAAEGSGDFKSLPSSNRHYRLEAHDASAILVGFSVYRFVGRNSIPKLSAFRIYYRLHPLGSNGETPDSNPPDNRPQDCLSMFRLSTIAVPCYPWQESSGMGLWGSY